MTDNVVYVDFNKSTVVSDKSDIKLENYLTALEQGGLCKDDIADLRDAIANFNDYQKADIVIRNLADCWFNTQY